MTMTHKEALEVAVDAYWQSEAAFCIDDMEAAIRAYVEARGLVMVPREPTGKMRAAQALAEASYATDSDADSYAAMLAAAPDPFTEE